MLRIIAVLVILMVFSIHVIFYRELKTYKQTDKIIYVLNIVIFLNVYFGLAIAIHPNIVEIINMSSNLKPLMIIWIFSIVVTLLIEVITIKLVNKQMKKYPTLKSFRCK